jgi:glycine cleavage system aminomethyltransferase T
VTELAFMSVDADGAIARSPMERVALASGARTEQRGSWNVVIQDAGAGFADRSHIRKLEVHGPAGRLGHATLADDGAWWCPITPTRTLVLGGEGPAPADALDMTCAYAALELIGPLSGELLARFCAIDVRPAVMPVGAFRPGSVARTPGYVLRTGADSLLVLVGWALGEYLWRVVDDAARALHA